MPNATEPLSYRAIERLVADYALLVDQGDFGGVALQPIVSGRYADRFHRTDGQWAFAERAGTMDLIGDVSHHLRR
ncbi:hypothetical protein C5E45_31470 [Nocardia nova]|uniref:SnoaL-like domain-containing protein n=1 Tax=Nocardia nova TaxID=37330 RepID=A0A2S6AGQ6_9NOCA|nr:hypothetical protein C5E41_29805 [Nocardia nova]PPJ33930.1 hypothetical protein C5E45_31470 [Nocardia nova]